MNKGVFYLLGATCAVIGTSAFADGWTHSFSRGFDLYLTGTEQSGIRLVCDRDFEDRNGSFLELQTSVTPTTQREGITLVIGDVSLPVSGVFGFTVLFKDLAAKDRSDLGPAFAVSKTIQIRRGRDMLAEVAIGTGRPPLCD